MSVTHGFVTTTYNCQYGHLNGQQGTQYSNTEMLRSTLLKALDAKNGPGKAWRPQHVQTYRNIIAEGAAIANPKL
jgi:hypothetical protein